MAECRLDKLLSNRTAHSRSEIKSLLKQGMIQVDGRTEHDGGRKVNPDTQEITCAGKKLHGGSHLYLIMNKPEGIICATEDRQHKTVLDLLPAELRVKGLFPAGRLDIDSTGLVLLTDDGGFSHQMLSPRHHVDKYYLIRLARPFEEAYIQKFSERMTLADGTECLPARVQALPEPKTCLVCLHEGKYHQVKRMFAAAGNHVEHLHRIAVGGMLLPPDLPSGDCLEILHKDIQRMLKSDTFPEMYEQIVSDFSSYLINVRQ